MQRKPTKTGPCQGLPQFWQVIVAMAITLLAGCSSMPKKEAQELLVPQDPAALQAQAVQAMRSGDAGQARKAAEMLLMRDMRAPQSHLLLGAAHQMQDDPALVDLAGSGFESATRLGEGGPWPHYLAGVNLMRQQRHQAAA
ncbi:MAG: hypothetical protein ABIP44_11990, partial [Pseudoxanthomonas sp.]